MQQTQERRQIVTDQRREFTVTPIFQLFSMKIHRIPNYITSVWLDGLFEVSGGDRAALSLIRKNAEKSYNKLAPEQVGQNHNFTVGKIVAGLQNIGKKSDTKPKKSRIKAQTETNRRDEQLFERIFQFLYRIVPENRHFTEVFKFVCRMELDGRLKKLISRTTKNSHRISQFLFLDQCSGEGIVIVRTDAYNSGLGAPLR